MTKTRREKAVKIPHLYNRRKHISTAFITCRALIYQPPPQDLNKIKLDMKRTVWTNLTLEFQTYVAHAQAKRKHCFPQPKATELPKLKLQNYTVRCRCKYRPKRLTPLKTVFIKITFLTSENNLQLHKFPVVRQLHEISTFLINIIAMLYAAGISESERLVL